MSHVVQPSRRFRATAVVWWLLLFSVSLSGQSQSAASSAIPHLVKYAGVVKDASGRPLTGTVGVTFAFYAAEQGGSPLWIETQNVQVDSQGRFSVFLGATKSDGLPQDLFVSGEARWLGVQPEGQSEQSRTQLISVPYAMKAGDAETIGGLPVSAFVLAAASNGTNTSPSPGSSPLVPPALGGSGTVNFVPLWTPDGNTLGNSVLFQSGTGTTAKIGVNTNTPATTLDVKGAGTIRGTLSLPSTGNATAAGGKNSQPVNWTASAFNSGTSAAVSQNFRWQAEPAGNNTTSPSGKFNLLFGSGSNQPTETGLSIGSNGQITFAAGQTFPGTGTGTITGVTAGTDLTGGGSTGAVTLSLDTTKVPQLNTTNVFIADQSITGNETVSGTVTSGTVNATGSYLLGGTTFGSGSQIFGSAFLGFAGDPIGPGTNQTAVGYQALHSANAASYNQAFGYQALYSDTTGSGNVANGWGALFYTTTGSLNTATGNQALQLNTMGWDNTATGSGAVEANTTGSNNTGNGSIALYQSTTGNDNTGDGFAALGDNTTGNQNSALGSSAGQFNSTGSDNTSIGYNSGNVTNFAATTGSNNTFLGANTSTLTQTTLTNASAIGANAAVTISNAMVLGSINGTNGATADTLVGIGTTAPAAKLDVHGTANFTGLITFAAGQTFPGAGTITAVNPGTDLTGGGSSGSITLNVDTSKVMTGVIAGTGLTGGGNGNVQTLSIDTTKIPQLTAANTFAANQTVSGNLTATGVVSGSSYQIGSTLFDFGSITSNSAFLGFSGNATTNAVDNTAAGWTALAANTTGCCNTASGWQALNLNNTGAGNTAIGWDTLSANTSGSNNTALGYASLGGNNTGTSNTALGYASGPGSSTNFALTNSTAVGARAEVDASNSMVLGSINGVNLATASTNVGIGITKPTFLLHIGNSGGSNYNNFFRVEGPSLSGSGGAAASFGGFGDFDIDAPGIPGGRFVVKESGLVGIGTGAFPGRIFTIGAGKGHAIADGWDVYSSRRWKTNIHTLDGALDKVEQLRGVSYDRKDTGKHEIGVIAEEVGQILPEVVTYESNGKDAQGVDYSRLTALLIEAVKQQQHQLREQSKNIQLQQKQIRLQQKRIRLQEEQAQAQQTEIRQLRTRDAMLETRLAQLETRNRNVTLSAVIK